jgi:NAD(P)-dependent dehydrogenase (short-subunit alcohol dehydrogenase family)
MKKSIVITGATSGIGHQTALALARLGARVVITGRDEARGQESIRFIQRESGNDDVHLVLGDLSHRAGLLALAEELKTRFPRIDVLINNAGAYASTRTTNADGVELGFAMNVVAPWALTHALLPCLEAARPARVVNVTGGDIGNALDPDDLQAEKGFRGLYSYSHAKRALDALSLSMARELAPRGVFLNVVYPGQALTTMTRSVAPSSLPWWMRWVWSRLIVRRADDAGKSARKASRSSVHAATAAELEGVSGAYLDTNSRPARVHATVKDLGNQARVIAAVERAWAARADG